MGSSSVSPATERAEFRKIILERYESNVAYYQVAARNNKRAYKIMRYLTIFLGATVTLISSLAAASFVKGNKQLEIGFALATPILAALMAIVGGVSQTFQWGATWSDMEITKARLERERDRVKVTSLEQLDPVKEMATVDDLVLGETQGFFQRLFGTGGPRGDGAPAAK